MRYMMFGGSYYYPCGGLRDFIGFFESIDDAKKIISEDHDWVQILDTEMREVYFYSIGDWENEKPTPINCENPSQELLDNFKLIEIPTGE